MSLSRGIGLESVGVEPTLRVTSPSPSSSARKRVSAAVSSAATRRISSTLRAW